jgi:hypothetical protein
MSASDEIDSLRRRIGAVEYELAQLKHTLDRLEAGGGEAMRSEALPAAIPTASVPSSVPAATLPTIASIAEALPPVLPVSSREESDAQPSVGHDVPPAPQVPRSTRKRGLREWLEPLQLWPPSGEDNAEVRLGAWWATRVGALFAVIGVVFLGIYVSRNSQPWLRLAEIGAVTAGVLGLGHWLERKLPTFGAIVFGAGLALVYFCAFAAYAVAPMKVIDRPSVATACELIAVAGILAVAWRRGSHPVATMAVGLGHVTAFLALRGDTAGFGPWVVMLLGAAAVWLRVARGWQAPSAVAMPLAWALLAVATFAQPGSLSLPVWAAWLWSGLFFALYLMRDWIIAWRGGELSRVDRAVQVTHASLAVAVTLAVTLRTGSDRLPAFFFAAGIALLATAWAWRRVGVHELVPVFACKSAGLVALGVIAEFEGPGRSLILLAQAFVMLVSARQSGIRGLRTATIVVGAVAMGFFLSELRPENAMLRAGATVSEIAFLLGSTALLSAFRRWLTLSAPAAVLGGVVLGLAAISTVLTWDNQGWQPALAVGLVVGMVPVAAAMRTWLPFAVAGGMLVVVAHAKMWLYPELRYGLSRLWLNQAVLLAVVGCAGASLTRWRDGEAKRPVQGTLAAVGSATLIAVAFKAFPPAAALTVAAGLSFSFVAVAGRARSWPLAGLAAVPLALGLAFFAVRGGRGEAGWLWLSMACGWAAPICLVAQGSRLASIQNLAVRHWTPLVQVVLATGITVLAVHANLTGGIRAAGYALAGIAVVALLRRFPLYAVLEAAWVFWVAALVEVLDSGMSAGAALASLVSWAPAWWFASRWSPRDALARPPWWRAYGEGIQVSLATLLGLALCLDVTGAVRLGAIGAVAVAALTTARVGGVIAARTAVAIVASIGWVLAWLLAGKPLAQGWGLGLLAVITAGVAVALLPLLLEPFARPQTRRRTRWVASAAGLALVFYTFGVQRSPVADFATIGWGIAAVSWFLAGLFARSRPHRLSGLAGLALCVPRAFWIDLDSTLHRIAAFVALGVVLLWVGFSYHRFRHLIVDDDKKL